MPYSTVAKEVRLHPGQAPAWNSDARFVCICAGTGGGKTYFGPIWLYREISKHPGDDYMVIAPTFKILKRATIKALVEFFRGTDLEGRLLLSKGEYVLPTGGIIYLLSANKPQHLEGGQIRGAWLDEAGLMDRWTWVVIQARLGLHQGRALLTTTPYGENWLYWDFFRLHEDGDPNYFVVQFSSIVNPYYSRTEYERMRGVLTEDEFGRRYDGQFRTLSGLIFPDLMRVAKESVLEPQPRDAERMGGLDPGWAVPFAGLTVWIGGDSRIHIYHELYEVSKFLRDIAPHLDRNAIYWMDPAAARERSELEAMGFDIRKGDNNLLTGIRKVNEYAKDGRLVIPPEIAPNLVSESAVYKWAKVGDKPAPNQQDHLCDTLRYLIMGLEQRGDLDIYYL